MIKQLSIENFRGIKKISFYGIEQFTLLAGTNNCGKSSVLESVYLWANAAYPQTILHLNSYRGLNGSFENLSQLYYGTDTDKEIKIETVSEQNKERNVSVKIQNAMPLQVGFDSDKAILEIHVSVKEDGESKEYILRNNINDARGIGVKIIPAIYYGANFVNAPVTQFLAPVIVGKKKAELIKVLQKIDDSIQDFQMANNNELYFDIGQEKLVRYEIMGDGIRKALILIAAIFNVQNGILLIDEFENGLHHSSMDIVWQAVIEAAVQNNVQVIATTHSYECIQSYSKNMEEKNRSDMAVIRIDRKNGKHKAVKLNGEDLHIAIENDWEIR